MAERIAETRRSMPILAQTTRRERAPVVLQGIRRLLTLGLGEGLLDEILHLGLERLEALGTFKTILENPFPREDEAIPAKPARTGGVGNVAGIVVLAVP